MKKIWYCLLLFFTIAGCNTSNNLALKKEKNKKTPTTLKDIAMLLRGTDFFAEGTDPSHWILEMNIDDTIRFEAENGLALKFAYNQLTKEHNKENSIYTTKIKAGSITILVTKIACKIPSHEAPQTRQVSFIFNNVTYSGCGRFVSNNKLESKWILEKIGNTAINTAEYSSTPSFDFNLVKNTFLGYDGCNTIKGKIEVQGNRIQFYNMEGKITPCTKKNINNIVVQQISNKLVDYYFKENKLYLYLSDDNLLVFIKK